MKQERKAKFANTSVESQASRWTLCALEAAAIANELMLIIPEFHCLRCCKGWRGLWLCVAASNVHVSCCIPVDAFVTAPRRHALFAKILNARCLLSVRATLAEYTNRCWHAETRIQRGVPRSALSRKWGAEARCRDDGKKLHNSRHNVQVAHQTVKQPRDPSAFPSIPRLSPAFCTKMSSRAATEPLHVYEISDFKFHNGSTLPKLKLAYKILNPHNSKIAVVHTCFKGRLDTTLTHADGALKNHKIILIALLGNGESSSPSNTPNFPAQIEYMDCVSAQHSLLTTELGIKEVDVMLGFSMGGQMTYHWATSYPDFVKHAVIVCSSAKTSRHNYQFLEGPKAALQSAASPERGIRAFGKAYSAWLTSAEWFDEERYQEMGFQHLRDWDDVTTIQGYEGWTGDDLLAMLGMWQRGDVGRCTQSKTEEDALKSIKAKVLLMPCATDQYFRPYVSEREVTRLSSGSLEIMPSIWGHIAGGGANAKDVEWMDHKIKLFLRGLA